MVVLDEVSVAMATGMIDREKCSPSRTGVTEIRTWSLRVLCPKDRRKRPTWFLKCGSQTPLSEGSRRGRESVLGPLSFAAVR